MKKLLLISWLAAGLLFTRFAYAVDKTGALLDLLVEKGIVTKDEAANLRADIAVKEQDEKSQKKEFNILAGKPIKISGYTQVRYRTAADINDTFDIRRARLDIKGDITERFDYRTQVEFGGNSGPFLLDATVGYKVNPYLKLTAGQFKIPFSQENLISSPKLETINRSQVVEALVARGNDVIGNQNGRDIGVQASGSFLKIQDNYLFDYALGVFNGAGINRSDTNEQKDFVGRLVAHPIKDLTVGGSYYAGRATLSTTPARPERKQDRDRIGGEFAYVHDPISLKGEYIVGDDGATHKDGWYLQAGYFVIPKKLQGIFKFDTYDSDTKAKNNYTNVYTAGVNYYFNKWTFAQVNYELKNERRKREIPNNALIGQLTLQF